MASKPRPKWEEVAGPVEERLFRWSRQRVQRPWGGNSKEARTGEQGARVPGRSPSSLQRTALSGPPVTRVESLRVSLPLPEEGRGFTGGDASRAERPGEPRHSDPRCGPAPHQPADFHFSLLQLPCFWNSRLGPTSVVFKVCFMTEELLFSRKLF